MNSDIVGYVKNVNGIVVKKDIALGKEENLKEGDILILGDSIWVRSLDAKATLSLHKIDINLTAGMRITLDEKFLKEHNTFEFFHENEIKIPKRDKTFKLVLDTDYQSNNSYDAEDIIINDINSDEDYDNLTIDYKFVSYKKTLTFKLTTNEKIVVKSYLMGCGGHILERPIELENALESFQEDTYLVIANKFKKANSYLIYLNILNSNTKSIFKEVFCEVDVRVYDL